VVWAAVLEINYALSYVACERGSKWMLHLTTFAGAAIVLAAAVAAWRARPQLDHGDESLPSTIENPGRTALVRTRFITIGGLGLCAWFVIVILAMEVPTSLLAACNP
jgi:hypothetical protein